MAVSTTDRSFNVALTADFKMPDGGPRYPSFNLDALRQCPAVRLRTFDEHRTEIGADQIRDAQGVIVLSPKVTAQSLASAENLLAIGRFGVGYDAVDVPACTANDVMVFITAGAVDRSVAEATLTWMLALTHHVIEKDRLVREGRWDDRSQWMGCELRDRTLGVIGCGGIGRTLASMTHCLGMRQTLAFDPYLSPQAAAELNVRLVSLEELLSTADFVSLHCPLNDATRGLLGRAQLALMRPQSYLINTARGGIVDEDALYEALSAGRFAGAALDCFAEEPLTAPPRLGQLKNVLLAPHCISWTDELFRDLGQAVCQGMIAIARGDLPKGLINPQVVSKPSFQQKWERLRIPT